MDVLNGETGVDKENSVGISADCDGTDTDDDNNVGTFLDGDEIGEDEVILVAIDGEQYESDNSDDSLVWKEATSGVGLVCRVCSILWKVPDGVILCLDWIAWGQLRA